eukprot:363967-Chlamydomonas_euryale.AAC.3
MVVVTAWRRSNAGQVPQAGRAHDMDPVANRNSKLSKHIIAWRHAQTRKRSNRRQPTSDAVQRPARHIPPPRPRLTVHLRPLPAA